jgi:hypothetical protein
MRQHLGHNSRTGRWAGQAGNNRVGGLHEMRRRLSIPRATRDKIRYKIWVQIKNRNIHTIAQQRTCQFCPDIAQANEPDLHTHTALLSRV